MKKIPTLFMRNYDGDRKVRDEITPGCEWVIAGEGVATRKYDGTCCLIRDGKLYKRYTHRKGKLIPASFWPVTEPDPITGKQEGWIPVGDGPEDKYHREAFSAPYEDFAWSNTYELCGPKVQGNAESLTHHCLIPHGNYILNAPRDYAGIRDYLAPMKIEGIVWHHRDGYSAKIKRKDF